VDHRCCSFRFCRPAARASWSDSCIEYFGLRWYRLSCKRYAFTTKYCILIETPQIWCKCIPIPVCITSAINDSTEGAVLTTIMYGAPLSVMWEVVRTKSVEFMPLPLSAMSFLNSAVWSLYGFYVQDTYIGMPNNLGTVLTVAQVRGLLLTIVNRSYFRAFFGSIYVCVYGGFFCSAHRS